MTRKTFTFSVSAQKDPEVYMFLTSFKKGERSSIILEAVKAFIRAYPLKSEADTKDKQKEIPPAQKDNVQLKDKKPPVKQQIEKKDDIKSTYKRQEQQNKSPNQEQNNKELQPLETGTYLDELLI